MTTYQKDPEATLDYEVDWSTFYLDDGETISSYVVTVPAGIAKAADSQDDGVVTIWLTGGTAGTSYRIECKITTSAGRTEERSFQVRVRER